MRSSCRQGTWGYRSGANVSPLTNIPPDIAPFKLGFQSQERPSVVVVPCSHKKYHLNQSLYRSWSFVIRAVRVGHQSQSTSL